jgi:hypothetical protein
MLEPYPSTIWLCMLYVDFPLLSMARAHACLFLISTMLGLFLRLGEI